MKMKCKNCDHELFPEWQWAWVAHAIKGSNVKTLERMCYGCLIPESDKWKSYESIGKWDMTTDSWSRELYLVQD